MLHTAINSFLNVELNPSPQLVEDLHSAYESPATLHCPSGLQVILFVHGYQIIF